MLYGYSNNIYTLSGSAAYGLIPSYSVSWQGDTAVSASLLVSGSSTANIFPATTGAWSTSNISYGSVASFYMHGPVGSAMGLTQQGLAETGISFEGFQDGHKVEKLTGIVTSDVTVGVSSLTTNYITASSNTIALKNYTVDYNFPAYAGVWEFNTADTNVPYVIDPDRHNCLLSAAWYSYNDPSEYEKVRQKDVYVNGVANTFSPAISATNYSYQIRVPIVNNTGTGTLSFRYLGSFNGSQTLSDITEGVRSEAVYPNHISDLDYDSELGLYVKKCSFTTSFPAGSYNPLQYFGFWVEQSTFSAMYGISSQIKGELYVSGIAP